MAYYDLGGKTKSEFNMSILTLTRYNDSLVNSNNSQRERDLINWFHELLILYKEASTEMGGELRLLIEGKVLGKRQTPDIEEKRTKLLGDYGMVEECIEVIKPLVNKFSNGDTSVASDLFEKLMYTEIFLRKLLKEAGIYMKEKQDFLAPQEEW